MVLVHFNSLYHQILNSRWNKSPRIHGFYDFFSSAKSRLFKKM